jgi:hypothetical protein
MQVETKVVHKQAMNNNSQKIHHGLDLEKSQHCFFYSIFCDQ